MLKKIVTSAATLCFLISIFAAVSHSQVCQPAPVGLTSWWSADGNTLDSRSRNNGTLQNGATFSLGHVGQAFSFDGVNDFAEAPDSSTLDVQQFTIGSWVFPTSDVSGGAPDSLSIIVAKESATTNQYILGRKNNTPCGSGTGIPTGNFAFYVEGLARLPNDCSAFVDGNAFLPLNTWSHVALTYDGANVSVFVNGNLTRTIAAAGTIPDTTGTLQIGGRVRSGTSFWAGQIDEPSIYNRPLSASEIAAIHAAGTAGKCKPTATVSPSGQVGWWAGDGNANDIAGTNNGTLQNGARFAVGKVGQGFNLDGVDDYVDIGDLAQIDNATELTVMAWVKRQNDTGLTFGGIIGKYDGATTGAPGNSFLLYLGEGAFANSGSFVIGFDDNTLAQTVGTTVIPNDTWTLVTATWRNSDGALKIYKNGTQEGATVFAGAGRTMKTHRAFTAKIGEWGVLQDSRYKFPGQLDEATVYNRALTDAEITSVFNAGIGGQLKETLTTGATATVGDVTVTYTGSATRRTQEIPLEEAVMPALPAGMAATGLLYDIATDVIPSGTTDLCFNLQAFAALSNAEFLERRILHLEGGTWTNRTVSRNFATKTICAQVLSLSPFAIVDSNLSPTAASVSVGGRVVTADGLGIGKVVVSIEDMAGNVRRALTNPFGYYKFDDVEAGAIYIVSVQAKQYQFENPIRMVNVVDELADVDFTALPAKLSLVEVLRASR